MKKIIPIFLGLLMVAACENKAYDTENLDTEMTLFENEISVPVGNFGPFNLELITKSEKLRPILGSVFETEKDGTLLCKDNEDVFKINAYEILAKTKDVSQPFSYPIGEKMKSPSTLAGLLQSFGFRAVDQHLTLNVNNPLSVPYTLGGDSYILCKNTKTYTTCFENTSSLEGIEIPRSYSATNLLEINLPDTVGFTPSEMGYKNLSLNLPANLGDQIRSSSRVEFVFGSTFSCHVAAGEKGEIPLSMFGMGTQTFKFNLPIASYKFKEVEASLVLENTLPLQVTLSNVQLMTGEKPEVDENLLVSPDELVIKGGSLEAPGSTPITLNIKALEGAIPNITGVKVTLAIKSDPDHADTRLSLKQGVSAKSASATLRGGITIGGSNE